MKRILLLCLAVFGLTMCALAHPVNLETATTIAARYMSTHDLQLTATYRMDNGIAAFYVFNTSDGFVIVAADDCETPIIGYSHEGRFYPNNVPIQLEGFLQDFAERIQYGIENHIVADATTIKQWESVKTTGKLTDSKSAKSVPALLTSKWHQGCLYNSLCPTMTGPCEHAEVGCVAVAMAQIMHYWGYPEKGWGSHSYLNAGLTLSADFGNTVYDWEHMPDSLTENSSEAEIEAVATLLYHCGVAVEMSYGVNGSTSTSKKIPDALIRYFNYSKHIHREKRSDFSDEEWLTLIKNSLDSLRPVQYSGFGVGIGHAFVCDGYDENDLLHFNWGWGGNANGYFALGNLNPNGYNLNTDNYAVFDIIPQYEPYIVTASAFPSTAGTVHGNGEYHRGESCTLAATPVENSRFLYWKKNGEILSRATSYTFEVLDDIDDIEANFSYMPIKQITASYFPEANNPNSLCVSLSWTFGDTEWTLLKQFDINKADGLVTDGEYIYTYNRSSNPPPPFIFGKYTMDGELIDSFDIIGAVPDGMGWDGNYFYSSNNKQYYNAFYLYCYDLDRKMLIDSTHMHMQFTLCSYDAENDGFWLCNSYYDKHIILKDRQSQTLINGPTLTLHDDPCGLGVITATDGTRHLLILDQQGGISDYDISNNSLNKHPHLNVQGSFTGASMGKYEGKDAMFVVTNNYYATNSAVHIYEINHHLPQIIGYRIHRSDNEGQTVILADEVTNTSFIDSTWNEINAGTYRFGISEVYANGNESEIIWSEPIVKNDFGTNENHDEPEDPTVKKLLEDGHIVIIKDGKRYNVSGQQLN